MKITGIETRIVNAEMRNWVFVQEEMVGAVPWYFDVVRGPIRMVDGFWQVPDAPGLGVEVDEAECARHPFAPEVLHTQNAVLTTARS